jgi:hypothetical protein
MTQMSKAESSRLLPRAPTFFEPHTTEDRDAILAVIAILNVPSTHRMAISSTVFLAKM